MGIPEKQTFEIKGNARTHTYTNGHHLGFRPVEQKTINFSQCYITFVGYVAKCLLKLFSCLQVKFMTENEFMNTNCFMIPANSKRHA